MLDVDRWSEEGITPYIIKYYVRRVVSGISL